MVQTPQVHHVFTIRKYEVWVPTILIVLQEPDLLVMGTSGRGPWGRALLGSVANEVLNEAWCDVLVVPQGPSIGRSHPPMPWRIGGCRAAQRIAIDGTEARAG
ncbi:MAG: universal stress protein [Gammaproteobacteria bacterium]